MLFGHQTDDTNQPVPAVNASGVNPLAVDPDTGVSLPVAPEDSERDSSQDTSAPDQPHHDDTPQASDDSAAPVSYSPSDDAPAAPAHDDSPQPAAGEGDLLDLKQQALQQLSPLVGHLDQTPEEKFRTTMMMIQSADNQALIKDAYAAAQAITDDKVRAQALLDIVNEINYFTQKASS